MICAKIEEYKVTGSCDVLREIRNIAMHELEGCKKATAFLFTIEEEEYKEALAKLGREILALQRDADGLFLCDGQSQEEVLYEILPVYALFETKLNKKEHYIDLVEQCKSAVKKYPGSKKIFMMLAEVLEYMSEEIFEQYKAVQNLLYTQYVAVSAYMDENIAYALAKACFYKAFLLEKYEEDMLAYKEEKFPAAYYAILRLDKRFERV